jgi:hypothetical protein
MTSPVQDHGREPLVFGPLQRLGQVRRLFCQHGDDLIEVAAGGSPGDAVVAGQRAGVVRPRNHPRTQHSLPKAGQRPAPARGTAPPALGGQQPCHELGQFPGDVKRGTIGDHVEPSVEGDLWRDLLQRGLHAHVPPARFLRVSIRMSLPGKIKPDCPGLFR